jgi:hypothetical protein
MPKRDTGSKIQRFQNFLEDEGLRPSVVATYVFRVRKYLEYSRTPNQEAFDPRHASYN